MAESSLTATEKLLSQMVNSISSLTERFSSLEEKMKKVESAPNETIEKLQAISDRLETLEKKPVSSTPTQTVPAGTVIDVPPAVLTAVREVLDERFSVKVKEYQSGFSYELEIIPPDVLKEFSEDRRVYVVHYSEGADGAKRAAEKVKKFCQAWAIKNGVSYDKGL